MQERAVNGRCGWARLLWWCVCVLGDNVRRSRQRVLAQPVPFLIALKQLAPRMQRLELRLVGEPIHAS